MRKKNIHWVCSECGEAAVEDENIPESRQSRISTWHKGTCDVCGAEDFVTEARDFGYPKFRKANKDG